MALRQAASCPQLARADLLEERDTMAKNCISITKIRPDPFSPKPNLTFTNGPFRLFNCSQIHQLTPTSIHILLVLSFSLLFAVSAAPAIDSNGLFSDYGPYFLQPREPDPGDTVHVRLQTRPNDVDQAAVMVRAAGSTTVQTIALTKESSGVLDTWGADFSVGSVALEYWFRVTQGPDVLYYNAFGTSASQPDRLNFRLVPGFHTPRWAQGVTWYQVFPDRFFDANPANNVQTGEYDYYGPVQARTWGTLPNPDQASREFFGGDLAGIGAKLGDYLQRQLGIEAIYLNPIFQSPSNHKYDTEDYRHVDVHFGSDDDLAALTTAARNDTGFGGDYRIRLVLDGVFNHCSDWHYWFDRPNAWPAITGAYESQASSYYNFFTFNHWPDDYATFGVSFGGHFDSMPKLNYADAGLRGEIYANPDAIARHWLGQPWRADGWRLDVGQEVGENGQMVSDGVNNVGRNNHTIWAAFRQAVKTVNPDAVIIGEFWGTSTPWLGGDQWDAVMNYNSFTTPVSRWLFQTDLSGNPSSITTADLHDWLQGTLADNTGVVRLTMMNALSTHDITRVRRRSGGDLALVKTATAMLMTYLGSPCIYYGDEIGLDGGADPDNRRCFPWDELDQPERSDLLVFHRALIQLRREKTALRTGSYRELLADDASGTFAFARFDDKDMIITLARRKGTTAASISLPVWVVGAADGSVFTDYFSAQAATVTGGKLELGSVPGNGFRVLVRTNGRGTSARFAVEPGRQTTITLASPDGSLKAGWARISFDTPAMAGHLAAAESFIYANGSTPVTETILYPAELTTAFQLMVNYRQGQLNAGLALTNPGSQAAQATLRLTTQTGSVYTRNLTVGPGECIPRFLDGLFDDLPETLTGVLKVDADQPLAPMQLSVRSNSRGEFLLSALSVVGLVPAATESDLILNYMAVGGGYTTELRLTTVGSSAVLSGTITFFEQSGEPLILDWDKR